MTKLLVAGALAFAGLLAPAAQAICTYETCPGTSVVCAQVSCRICWYKPSGDVDCITR